MTIREELEWTEHLCLSERAQFSDATRGRPRPEEAQENDVRTCYQRDSDRILHSKSSAALCTRRRSSCSRRAITTARV